MKLKISNQISLPIDAVKKAEARIRKKIEQRGRNECWLWRASLDTSGYGQVRIAGKLVHVSRALFLLKHGFLPQLVMHSCDNPPCCNERHLLPGTKRLNAQDMLQKGRQNPAFGERNGSRKHPEKVPRGNNHYSRTQPWRLARGERSGLAKLTSRKVIEIRRLWFSKEITVKSVLARKFNISPSHIDRLLKGEGWV